MDIILRNLQRLVFSDQFYGQEAIEPMSAWKWNQLYKFTIDFGVGPWVADGFRRYGDDFFLKTSDSLREQFLLLGGQRDEENLDKFRLHLLRSQNVLNRFTRESLRAYYNDFINSIRNIEE